MRLDWTKQCAKAFQEAKEKLSTAEVLVHYDPRVPIRLAGDASSYGIGTVLYHMFADGTERPVAYASQTLLPNEQNYAQVENEALSLILDVLVVPPVNLRLRVHSCDRSPPIDHNLWTEARVFHYIGCMDKNL